MIATGSSDYQGCWSHIHSATLIFLLLAWVAPEAARAQHPHVRALREPQVTLAHEFSRVTGLRELRDGRVLIADITERRLVLADWRTGMVGQVGREGDGPGEYRSPSRLYPLAGDSTLMVDGTSRRSFLLDGDRIVVTIAAHEPLNARRTGSFEGADTLGRVLMIETDMLARRRGVRRIAPVLALLRAGERTDTVARVTHPARPMTFVRMTAAGMRMGYELGNPLIADEQAILFPDGWIALARVEPYRVEWLTPDGRTIVGPPLPTDTLRVDGDEKRFAARRSSYPGQGVHFTAEHFPDNWPPTLPPFLDGALLAAPGGQIVIRRTPSARVTGTRYDVVDRRGRLVDRLALAENEWIIGFGRTTVYVAVADDHDLVRLRRHPWP